MCSNAELATEKSGGAGLPSHSNHKVQQGVIHIFIQSLLFILQSFIMIYFSIELYNMFLNVYIFIFAQNLSMFYTEFIYNCLIYCTEFILLDYTQSFFYIPNQLFLSY